jgi:hypothetical protein
VIVADPGGQHGFHKYVQMLGHARWLHIVGQQHLPRRQRALIGPVTGGQPRDEVRVGAAAAAAGSGRIAQRAHRIPGATEPERRHRGHQCQRRHLVRVRPVRQVLQDRPAAHAPADQVHRRPAKRGDDRGQVVGVVPQPAGGVHRLGVSVAEPAQVDGQRPVLSGQRQHGRLPEQGGRHVAVHEQHRRAGAPGHRQHVDGQPAGWHPLGADPWQQRVHAPPPCGGPGSRRGPPQKLAEIEVVSLKALQ